MEPPLKIYLLGNMRFERSGAPKSEVSLNSLWRMRGMLAYLLLQPNNWIEQEQLQQLFWSDAPQETGRARTRTALSVLTTAVPLLGLRFEAKSSRVRLELGSAWLDLAALEAALDSSSDEEARAETLDRANKELLTGWNAAWVVIERERLRRKILDAGRIWLQEAAANGDWQQIIKLAPLLIAQTTR